MSHFLDNLWQTTLELAPWLLLGAFVAGLLHLLLPTNFIERQLTGRWSVLKAVALGVPLPLCSCGVIPMAVGMHQKRASRGATVGFLISTPQTGVDSILVSAAMLGWPFALFKVLAALVTGVVGGQMTNLLDKGEPSLPIVSSSPATGARRRSLRALIEHAIEILHSIWGWLVVGVVVSAWISTVIPKSAFDGLAAYGGLAAMGVALAISLPLYVCATASVPIAAALVHGGLPPGAALVFLMAGPATNLATIGAVHRTLGMRSLVVYLTTIIAGSILGGVLCDQVLVSIRSEHLLHEHLPTWWNVASAWLLVALIAWFAITDLFRKFRSASPLAREGEEAITLPVAGMTCDGCVAKIEKRLQRDTHIRSARVTLAPPEATVVGTASKQQVEALIEEAGFRVP